MPHVRRDVWKLSSADRTLEWYGKAVEALQQRPITDLTSWWSLGAMHGIHEGIWRSFGFISNGTQMPPPAVQKAMWKQCQHMSWYFLPWHRGYLVAFERIVRDAVVKLGGPADWALPYWNYSDPTDSSALELPRPFAKPTISGAKNFLFVKRRYGAAQFPNTQSPIVLDPRVVDTAATLRERFFEGSAGGGSSGFGGVETPFSHGDQAGTFGVLETTPHGGIHVFVGGGFEGRNPSRDPLKLGLMTNPDTAALDPIFWLHHANIDRLWNVWLRQPQQPGDGPDVFKNPTEADWLDGPHDRDFVMPRPDGTTYTFTARDVLDTLAPDLDYEYDDAAVLVATAESLAERFESLGVSPERASSFAGAITVAPPKPAELLGASTSAVRLGGDVVEAQVRLDVGQREKLSTTLDVRQESMAVTPRVPDRVYLNLEAIKSPSDAGLFYVYVDLPQGADPAAHPDLLAGTLSLFGVSKASSPQGPAGGNGVNASFDITAIVDKMHVAGALGEHVSVKLVSAVPGAAGDDISIGRISVYRQGQ